MTAARVDGRVEGSSLESAPADFVRTPILPVNFQYSRSQLENLYVDLLSTIDYQFGVAAPRDARAAEQMARSSDFQIEAAVEYLQKAFHLTSEEHSLLCTKAWEKVSKTKSKSKPESNHFD